MQYLQLFWILLVAPELFHKGEHECYLGYFKNYRKSLPSHTAKESSSGSGTDDSGSLAGKVSAMVLSNILSFLASGSVSSIKRSSGSRESMSEYTNCSQLYLMLRFSARRHLLALEVGAAGLRPSVKPLNICRFRFRRAIFCRR